jgi:hypothetical protein
MKEKLKWWLLAIAIALAPLSALAQSIINSGPVVSQTGFSAYLANATTNTVRSVKTSPGVLAFVQCYSGNASVTYLQVFALPSTSVTLGTTTPAMSFAIGPTSTVTEFMSPIGILMPGGISIAATTTATGSTAPASAIDCNLGFN